MKWIKSSLQVLGWGLLGLGLFGGCASTDNVSASAGFYYGTGYYDPWYYGDYYYGGDIIVTPPERPERPEAPPHPSHPIVRPPPTAPRPTPMPSIPSRPRASFRR